MIALAKPVYFPKTKLTVNKKRIRPRRVQRHVQAALPDPKKKEVNPIKKFIMKVFKIKEIDYEKFRKEDKWAIKIKGEPPRE